MKILTNIQTSHLAGISQTFSSFLGFVEQDKKSRLDITGIEVRDNPISHTRRNCKKKDGKFTLISAECNYPKINEATKNSNSLRDIENSYSELICRYQEVIREEKPDLILLNGTYFMPWCLFKANQGFNIPVVLHYHGILSKEIAHLDEKPRSILCQMEQAFDRKDVFYIFPSSLAKEVVEREVFGHKIKNCSILPNPVPRHFFQINKKGSSKNIGIVSRWSRVKNPSFIKRIAKYNQKHSSQFSINIVTDLKSDHRAYEELSRTSRFWAPMNNQRLADFYGHVGIVISPSVFETYGNVAQEALAANTPALISPNMGVSETFKKLGLQDWIVDFGSVRNVYAKAKEISRQEVSPGVRKIIYDEYSPDRIHSQMLSILRERRGI